MAGQRVGRLYAIRDQAFNPGPVSDQRADRVRRGRKAQAPDVKPGGGEGQRDGQSPGCYR